jgi:hypothetical protein
MLDKILFFAAGLIIGWNVLPQPVWVKTLYDGAVTKIKKLVTPKSE